MRNKVAGYGLRVTSLKFYLLLATRNSQLYKRKFLDAKFILCSLSFAIILSCSIVIPVRAEDHSIRVENFSIRDSGNFPSEWKMEKKGAEELYRIMEEDGNPYLKAETKGQAIAIAKKYSYELNKYPLLSWKWRLHKLPKEGDERYKERADSAGGLYLIFGRRPFNKFLKYVWSTSLAKDTEITSPYSGRTKIIVLRTGNGKIGQWIEEKVNVYEDYTRVFKEEPSKVRGIALMTDSDNTNSEASMDYDEIRISVK